MARGKSPPAPAAKPEPAGSAGRQQAAMANLEAAVGNLAERRMSEGGTPVESVRGMKPASFNYESAEMELAIKITKLMEQEKFLRANHEVQRLRAWLQRIHDFSASAYTREDVQKALAGEVVP